MNAPELLPVADEAAWRDQYEQIVRHDDWLREKYDRGRRLAEHYDYMKAFCPELLSPPGKHEKGAMVVDVGPGPGEFLEWCRMFDWPICGLEAPSGEGGMGEAYLSLSRLLHERQEIPVSREGFEAFARRLRQTPTADLPHVFAFNFRGSWEQCWAGYLDGPSHHEHHDCSLQSWRWCGELREAWLSAFEAMERALVRGGFVLIHANDCGVRGASDQERYDQLVQEIASCCGLRLALRVHPTVHKWRKP